MKYVLFVALVLTLAAGTVQAQAALRPGDMCLAFWEETGFYYAGTFIGEDTTAKGDGFLVVFADGEQGVIPRDKVKPLTIKVGSAVQALWTDREFYPGKVAKIVGGALYIEFDDGDKGWTSWAGIAIEAEEE
jgi:hypothetical protein